MKQEIMQKSFIEKLEQLRKLLLSRFPSMEMHEFRETMAKIAHHHYNKQKGMLLGETRELYNFLIENNYNPFTVYRWLLLERVPDDIRFQIKNKQISQKNAISKAFERRIETMQEMRMSIKQAGLELIRRM